MRRVALLLVVLGVLGVPTGAAAHRHRRHPRPAPIPAAMALAVRFWHAVPCGGHISVDYGLPPVNDEAEPVGIRVGMWSSWTSDAGVNTESGTQPFSNCVLGINSTVWRTQYFMAYTAWPDFSAMVIHEYGHLLGHSHSTDPRNVMYPEAAEQIWFTGETLWH